MKAWIHYIVVVSLLVFVSPQCAFAKPASPSTHPQLEQALQSIDKDSWINQNQLSYQALDALDFIQSAFNHGLNPDDYQYQTLLELASNPTDNKDQFERLLVNALLQLVQDLMIGRLDPAQVDNDWFIPRDQIDALDKLQYALSQHPFKSALNNLAPAMPEYFKLQQGLSRYRSYVERGGWSAIPAMPLLRPGERHDAIPQLRARLAVEETALSRTELANSKLYDDELVTAVKRFQHRNGIKVDGIIGSETQAALNISAEQRLKQISLNLERLRWLPDQLGDRYILVNIANYQLKAVDQGQAQLNMRVIVGKQKRPTPSFVGNVTHIVFNPYWNVPNKLARLDLLPKQQANPDYFFLNKFRIFLKDNPSQEVDPYLVDWDSVSSRQFPYRLQQLPGEHNALGQMKFMFPNPWNIYLHDTPNSDLFEKHIRNFSSGCIRVEKPVELAEFMLNQTNSAEFIQQRIDSQQNQGQKIKQPLPVYAVYFTVWPDEDTVSFSPDLYQRDQEMANYL